MYHFGAINYLNKKIFGFFSVFVLRRKDFLSFSFVPPRYQNIYRVIDNWNESFYEVVGEVFCYHFDPSIVYLYIFFYYRIFKEENWIF